MQPLALMALVSGLVLVAGMVVALARRGVTRRHA